MRLSLVLVLFGALSVTGCPPPSFQKRLDAKNEVYMLRLKIQKEKLQQELNELRRPKCDTCSTIGLMDGSTATAIGTPSVVIGDGLVIGSGD